MKSFKLALVVAALGATAFEASACYTVYDASNRVVYNGMDAPVDMSLPVQTALQRRFGQGMHMAFEQGTACRDISVASMARSSAPAAPPNTAIMGAGPSAKVAGSSGSTRPAPSTSPMLTDRQTALAMNLPHRVLSGDIVLVPAQAAARVDVPNVTVVPAGIVGSVDASRMAARMPARSDTVITEMHNPPMTVVQRGGDMIVSQR